MGDQELLTTLGRALDETRKALGELKRDSEYEAAVRTRLEELVDGLRRARAAPRFSA